MRLRVNADARMTTSGERAVDAAHQRDIYHGVCCEQQLDRLSMTLLRRDEERRGARVGLGVDRGAGSEQQTYAIGVALLGGDVECGGARGGGGIDGGARREQQFESVEMTVLHEGREEGGG